MLFFLNNHCTVAIMRLMRHCLSSILSQHLVQARFNIIKTGVIIRKVIKNHTSKDSRTKNLVIQSHRHFRIVESNIVNSTAGQVNPAISKSLYNYGIRYIDVDYERNRVNCLQSLSLRACSGES